MLIIGIDPGQNGAAVLMSSDGSPLDEVRFSISTEFDIAMALKEWPSFYNCETFAYLEKVHSMPGQGVASSFKFGKNFGFLIGCLTSLLIPFEYVTPQKWQKELSCMSKGDKNVTKQKAQQLFPKIAITHSNADALLIAEYGRRAKK